jgi:hypothetical protein
MGMGQGEELVPSLSARESRAAKQKPKLAEPGGQGGHLANDSGRLV